MDLATARTRATISVPEAGELLGIGRDASYAAAAQKQIPVLRLGRALRVPVPALLQMLQDPTATAASPELLRPVHDGLDPENDSGAGVTHAGPGNVVAFTGARREQNAPQPP